MTDEQIEQMVHGLSEEQAKDLLLKIIHSGYAHIPWPDSQQYMDEEWFDSEAVLDVEEASAYFIPINRTL